MNFLLVESVTGFHLMLDCFCFTDAEFDKL
uniref:Uncharacterized protein n=1 Tax=Anguilla anguilla TaxID=7936 RepID=A0A0E9VDY5_ANGAN